ncbi:hypothetical protein [Niallia sp. 01092]|uniref:hypothetical protein n=1 Tax=unclassified Niallia TaxID=2837522 RepID=UPI003FD377E4
MKIIKYWLSIPRWFRIFTLSAITIYVIWSFFIAGVKSLYDFHLDLPDVIISLIAAAFILFIFNIFGSENK